MTKRISIILFYSILICCTCNKDKNSEIISKNNIFENIVLNGSNGKYIDFEFNFNDKNYFIDFYGKDITVARVIENKYLEYLSMVLNSDDVELITDEIKKSKIIENDLDVNNIIKIIITEYEFIDDNENKEEISDNTNIISIPVPKGKYIVKKYIYKIISTDILYNYLTEKLLYINNLPIYTVQEGDTLSSICLKLYGDTNYEKIVNVNPGMKLPNQYLIVRPNQNIRIPMK